jgi:hypothetical protein
MRAPLNTERIAFAEVGDCRRVLVIQEDYPFRANINTIPTPGAESVVYRKPLTFASYGFYGAGICTLQT